MMGLLPPNSKLNIGTPELLRVLPWRLALTHTYSFLPLLTIVIHSGDYFLFESDSEEEEEALPEDARPAAQSAFQVRWSHAFLLCLWSSERGSVQEQISKGHGIQLLYVRKSTWPRQLGVQAVM